jgi:hypothetical protein
VASRLRCLDYLQCVGFDGVIDAFWPDSFDLKIINILYQNIFYVASVRTDLDSLADVSIFSLMFT